jgi:hypothetical protein
MQGAAANVVACGAGGGACHLRIASSGAGAATCTVGDAGGGAWRGREGQGLGSFGSALVF